MMRIEAAISTSTERRTDYERATQNKSFRDKHAETVLLSDSFAESVYHSLYSQDSFGDLAGLNDLAGYPA